MESIIIGGLIALTGLKDFYNRRFVETKRSSLVVVSKQLTFRKGEKETQKVLTGRRL